MTIIEVNKENALKAYKEADENGKVLLKNLFGKEILPDKITDRIKTFDDVIAEFQMNGFEVSGAIDEVAYRKLKLIAKALNEGWTPDWDDENEYKYYPYFKMGSSGVGFSGSYCDTWFAYAFVGSRLCFKNRELAEYAGKQFEDIYKDFYKDFLTL